MSRKNDGSVAGAADENASLEATSREVSPRASKRDPPPPTLAPLADESAGAVETLVPQQVSHRSASADGSGFVPRPYMFVVDGEEVMPESTSQARAPPYWLLVDHTLAVIYCMCSPRFRETPTLGISQLTWALELLKTVKSRRGNYHKDVKLLMGAIEDRILDCYVAIGARTAELRELEASLPASNDKSADRKRQQPQPSAPPLSPPPRPSAPPLSPPPRPSAPPLSPQTSSGSPANRTSSRQEARDTEEEKKKQKAKPTSEAEEKEFADFEAGLRDQRPQQHARFSYDDSKVHEDDDVAEYYENLKNSDGRRVWSVTYEEVVARAPAAHEVPQRMRGPKKRRQKRLYEDADSDSDEDGGGPSKLAEKKASKSATAASSTMSRQNLMSFFSNWRQEQVERLQVEMQRLSNIEEFMARIDENFDRVLDKEVAKKLKEYKPDEKNRKPASDSARFANTR